MEIEDLAVYYPSLYHVAEADSWPGIRQNGLRSTSALLDLYGVHGAERQAIEAARREESVILEHPGLPRAVIRDNKPMSDTKLRAALPDDMSVPEWYRLLNGKVFFWTTPERMMKFLRAYGNRKQLVITVDTAALVQQHHEDVWLTLMNTGATRYATPRDRNTFMRINDFPFQERRKKRPLPNVVVEVAVEGMVPNVERLTTKVEVVA